MLQFYILYYILSVVVVIDGALKNGLLLLYRPMDVSNECAFSGRLRYDLSFGMGMSDTITMVFRTLNDLNYECNVEIATENENIHLVVVIKFPTNLRQNCYLNENAFVVMKHNKCIRLCEIIGGKNVYSPYFVITVRERLRFRFLSNSSINSHLNADTYQITATSARMKPRSGKCQFRNETLCVIEKQSFCFTSGVVCDGIKNCGVRDWFDERQSECSLPTEYLGYAPVIAVAGALACALLAVGHLLMRGLPPLASSFFIFNENEDNRLCIDPVLRPPDLTVNYSDETTRKISLIPLESSSSTSSTNNQTDNVVNLERSSEYSFREKLSQKKGRTVKSMTAKIQEKIRSVTGRGKLVQASAIELRTVDV